MANNKNNECGFTLAIPLEPGCTASKHYHYSGGWKKTLDYDLGTTMALEDIPVQDIDDLAEMLTVIIDSDRPAMIVRGGLTQSAKIRIARNPDAALNRRVRPKFPGDEPHLAETDRRWIMVDIDDWTIPSYLSIFDRDDIPLILEAAIRDLLHPAFHDARAFFQLSSSCGIAKPDILKVHLFYWLDRPASNNHIRAVLKGLMPGVCCSPFSAVQPHFIASPVLTGAPDPLPVRLGWVDGADDEVTLPTVPRPVAGSYSTVAHNGAEPQSGNWLEVRLSRIGEGLDGFHAAIRDTVWEYCRRVRQGGVTRNDEAFADLVARKVMAAPAGNRSAEYVRDRANTNNIQREINSAFIKLG